MDTAQLTYYFQIAPYPMIGAGGPAPTNHLNLEGAIQQDIDGVHLELRMRQAIEREGGEVDGVWWEDTQLPTALNNIDAQCNFYPRFFPGAVPAGKTVDVIRAQYKQEVTALFAAYGL